MPSNCTARMLILVFRLEVSLIKIASDLSYCARIHHHEGLDDLFRLDHWLAVDKGYQWAKIEDIKILRSG